MSTIALRPRTATEIVDAAIVLLRRNYVHFVAVSAVFLVPVAALQLVLPTELQALPRLLQQLIGSAMSAAIVVMTSDVYLGREVSVGGTVGRVMRRFGSIFGAALVQGLIIMGGLLMLVVPGIIFAAWTFAMPMVVVLEGADSGESFKRSRELARGQVGRIIGIVLVTFAVFVVAMIVLGMILGVLTSSMHVGARAVDVLGTLLAALAYPVFGIVTTLLYYDLRIRKEGFDLEIMAAELDQRPASPGETRPPVRAGEGAPGSDPDRASKSIRLR